MKTVAVDEDAFEYAIDMLEDSLCCPKIYNPEYNTKCDDLFCPASKENISCRDCWKNYLLA